METAPHKYSTLDIPYFEPTIALTPYDEIAVKMARMVVALRRWDEIANTLRFASHDDAEKRERLASFYHTAYHLARLHAALIGLNIYPPKPQWLCYTSKGGIE